MRFNRAEWNAIEDAAARADLSPTAFVGTAAAATARGTEVPGTPIRQAMIELQQAHSAVSRINASVNKLAASGLSGADVTPTQVHAAAAAAARVLHVVEQAAANIHRRLA